MTSDPVNSLPRKRRSLLRWIAALFLALLLLFLFQLLGPDPQIIVSRQTTFITEPLRPNGLPDYERYVLELNRSGVTAQNNAVVLLWPTLRGDAADPAASSTVRAELGMALGDTKYPALASANYDEFEEKIFAWIRNKNVERFEEYDPEYVDNQAVDKLMEQCMSAPWTRHDCTLLADFVHNNGPQLDLVVAASQRARFYWPTTSILNNVHEPLVCDYPFRFWEMHNVTNLSLRAMLCVGEERAEDAWPDVLALYRLARLCGKGNSLHERSVAFRLQYAAHNATIGLLHHGNLTTDLLQRVHSDLRSLPPHAGLAEFVDTFDRVKTLDAVSHMAEGDMDEILDHTHLADGFTYADFVHVNWNAVLSKSNAWYDRLVAALEIPEFAARLQAVEAVYADLRHPSNHDGLQLLTGVLLSRQYRTDVATWLALITFGEFDESLVFREAETNTRLELVRLAAALALFRAAHQRYPEQLAELAPEIINELPVDLYSRSQYMYRREEDGYLLFSNGPNGQDDGGSDISRFVLEGRPYDGRDWEERIPVDADDIAIRVPCPRFEVPRPPF